MQKYDLFLILSNNLSETETPAKVANLKETLVFLGAENVETADLGRQKLAYAVKGAKTGYFVNVFFALDPNKIADLKNSLNLDNEVARFMLSLKKNVPVPAETSAITSVFEKSYRQERGGFARRAEKPAVKLEKKSEKTEKKEIDLADINKKIDEILQQDNFVV